ncbi:MAG: OmpA family protein [Cyclobacteriaceae bacterium]
MRNFIAICVLLGLSFTVDAQTCSNVVDSRGVRVVTKNGLSAVAPNLPSAEFCFVDTDGDGVEDAEDECPEVAGLAEFGGCIPADTDEDGVIDAKDDCPNVAGTVNGCPDADNDGVIDSEDECADVAGTLNGCPDADEDGVKDAEDGCPNLAGTVAMGGCPDTDGDGVSDKDDHCPSEAGLADNAGCPELNEEEKAVLKEALEGVNFVSGKDVLTATSKPKLHNVAELLKAHAGYKLKVSGYTDSSGAEESNLALSKQRANAVKQYLIEDGIDASRVSADGYGEDSPIADNATAAGRAKNRRVEFEIVY